MLRREGTPGIYINKGNCCLRCRGQGMVFKNKEDHVDREFLEDYPIKGVPAVILFSRIILL